MAPQPERIYIGVVGGRTAGDKSLETAYTLGKLIAREGWVLVCGGMGGIMEAACRGAFEAGGTSLGILPGNSREEGNLYLTHAIVTGLGEVRNSIVAKSSHAVIAVSGSFGTLSEIAFAGLNGIPVVGIHSWRGTAPSGKQLLSFEAETPGKAVEFIKFRTGSVR